jgi:AraC-like DNA-binding protein
MGSWAHYWHEPTELAPYTLSPVGVGAQVNKTRAIIDRTLDATGVVVVIHGTGWYATDGAEPVPVAGPALLWLHPGRSHSYAPDPTGWDEQWMLFEGIGARLYSSPEWAAAEHGVVALAPAAVERFTWLIDELRTTAVALGRSALLRASVLMQRLLLLVDESSGAPGTDRDQDVLRQLAEDATRPLSVADRARRVGLSVGDLRALTQRAADASPTSLIEGVRISEGKRLLAESELPVQQIARLVGYDDPAYFSRVFSGRVGMPPSRYRDRSQ